MKKILVSPRLFKSDKGEVFESLALTWGTLLSTSGLLPVPFLGSLDPAEVLDETDFCGVLLTGGNDLSAVNTDPLSALRDRHERSLVDTALQRNLPVLGVCRGMQFLAHYFGSTLSAVSNHSGTRHAVSIEPNVLLGFKKTATLTVNSYHNWAVNTLSPCLTVVARTADGSIEAFVHQELSAAGIMWHPEREEPFSATDVQLLKIFFSC